MNIFSLFFKVVIVSVNLRSSGSLISKLIKVRVMLMWWLWAREYIMSESPHKYSSTTVCVSELQHSNGASCLYLQLYSQTSSDSTGPVLARPFTVCMSSNGLGMPASVEHIPGFKYVRHTHIHTSCMFEAVRVLAYASVHSLVCFCSAVCLPSCLI